jgi:hypothetical protein
MPTDLASWKSKNALQVFFVIAIGALVSAYCFWSGNTGLGIGALLCFGVLLLQLLWRLRADHRRIEERE